MSHRDIDKTSNVIYTLRNIYISIYMRTLIQGRHRVMQIVK